MRMLEREEEKEDAEVSWEDQQRINTFSKLNNRVRLLEQKLTNLKHEKEALDDLSTELELVDEDQPVLYKIGEAFVHIPHSGAIKLLEKNQAIVGAKVTKIAAEADECETEMKQLKVLLYAKFGKAINLDE